MQRLLPEPEMGCCSRDSGGKRANGGAGQRSGLGVGVSWPARFLPGVDCVKVRQAGKSSDQLGACKSCSRLAVRDLRDPVSGIFVEYAADWQNSPTGIHQSALGWPNAMTPTLDSMMEHRWRPRPKARRRSVAACLALGDWERRRPRRQIDYELGLRMPAGRQRSQCSARSSVTVRRRIRRPDRGQERIPKPHALFQQTFPRYGFQDYPSSPERYLSRQPPLPAKWVG